MPIPQPGSELAEPRTVFKGGFEDRVGEKGKETGTGSIECKCEVASERLQVPKSKQMSER